jgi:hypothetical protein
MAEHGVGEKRFPRAALSRRTRHSTVVSAAGGGPVSSWTVVWTSWEDSFYSYWRD